MRKSYQLLVIRVVRNKPTNLRTELTNKQNNRPNSRPTNNQTKKKLNKIVNKTTTQHTCSKKRGSISATVAEGTIAPPSVRVLQLKKCTRQQNRGQTAAFKLAAPQKARPQSRNRKKNRANPPPPRPLLEPPLASKIVGNPQISHNLRQKNSATAIAAMIVRLVIRYYCSAPLLSLPRPRAHRSYEYYIFCAECSATAIAAERKAGVTPGTPSYPIPRAPAKKTRPIAELLHHLRHKQRDSNRGREKQGDTGPLPARTPASFARRLRARPFVDRPRHHE